MSARGRRSETGTTPRAAHVFSRRPCSVTYGRGIRVDGETPLERIVAGITVGAILTVAFGLLALGYLYFWIVFPIGFAGVLPAAIGLVKLYERRRATDRTSERQPAADDSIEVVRERYARGELSDEEFDHRLERLLETESLDRPGPSTARDDEREEYDFERT
ncbi:MULTISPECIES: SHOCT domain-containing protein [Natrialbaceae]|uniref:SHOCT domain-containing protein n=1 Tax=Natrialbaceae TaxID=1644061 RepID=UPI00207D07E2|nr:SHOCT domain-containing protein [Natronococcus sp. CG52]